MVLAAFRDRLFNQLTTIVFLVVAGNVVSLSVGAIISYGSSLIWPANFNFDVARAMNAPDIPTGRIVDVTEKVELAIKDKQSVEGEEKSAAEITEEPASSSASILAPRRSTLFLSPPGVISMTNDVVLLQIMPTWTLSLSKNLSGSLVGRLGLPLSF